MGIYLNPGNAGFETIRKGIYIDKSDLIAYINQTLGSPDKLTCISRPRRFGKSFAAKMLCAYYDKSCDSKELFQDLKNGTRFSGKHQKILLYRKNIYSFSEGFLKAAARLIK